MDQEKNPNVPGFTDQKDQDNGKNQELYDVTELQNMTSKNESFLNHAISIFLESSDEAIVSFKNGLKEKNYKNIRDTAHKILPSYRHLKVNSVVPKLVEINTIILSNQKKDGMPQLVNDTISEMEKVAEVLKKDFKV